MTTVSHAYYIENRDKEATKEATKEAAKEAQVADHEERRGVALGRG
jgi:hypothetical protein